ncbi:hypothetical protein [Pseudooceanicola sp. MF1-13]|uniref:hypothetical protein n=1 Tax=Pseudooceanicola sp. MF1-13 TaxID=3379095 RepID=UPI0038923E3C
MAFVVVLVLFGLALAGVYMVLFRRGRRRQGVWVTLAALAGMLGAILWDMDRQAVADGWASSDDRIAARDAGFDEPDAWRAHLQKEAKAAAEQVRKAEEDQRRAGFHCLSAWSGAHPEFVDMVRDQLRDPSSFEHVETRVTPVDEAGQHNLFMTYRAANGFGGLNVVIASGVYATDGCAVTLVSLE